MAMFGDQLRQVLRRLGRAPLFTIITLITLGVGVGANTVIFSVLEGVLLKPLPYPQPEQLIGVWHQAPGVGMPNLNMAPSIYFIDREQNTTFQDIGVYVGDSLSVTGTGEPEQVRGLDVTDGTLPMLGVKPALGRLFTREDDSPGAPDTVLLSYGYWRQKFGGATSVIGKSITVDGKSREIIGVLPIGNRSFPAPEGFSPKLFEQARIAPNLRPLKQDVVGDIGKVLWVLMGSIAMVLLIACANVANLLLVRVDGRRQELAIRAALGAGWGRIATELMFESVILGLLGSLLGLALAYGALQVLVALAPMGLPRIHEIGIDLPVLLFTFAIAMFSSLLFGSIPIFKYAGAHLNTGLREGGRALSQSRQQHRARNVLVVVQVGLALVLLICSGLMIRTFRALMHVPPGFTGPDAVQTFRFYVPETEIPDSDRERLVRMDQETLAKLGAIPGVSSVSFSSAIPMDGHSSNDVLFAEDRAYAEGELPPIRRFKFVSPGFLATMGTPLIAGRDITWEDTYQKIPVAMISENFAKEYWHDARNALGKRIRVGNTDDWREIVGVVGDVYDNGVDTPAVSSVYWPVLLDRFEGQKEDVRRGIAFAIRSPRAGSQAFLNEVRETVWSVDPNIPLADLHTVGYFYTHSMARTSFTLVMLGVAGGMALLLGIVGVYGVIAYSVSQRTREIGIRMALGAQRKALVGMFVRQGLWLTGVGILCGLVTAFAVMRLMASLLFKVSPVDPVTYGAVTLGVLVTAYLACYLPSRRAAGVDPVDALRAE